MFRKYLLSLLLFMGVTLQTLAQMNRFPEDFKSAPDIFRGLRLTPVPQLQRELKSINQNPGLTREKQAMQMMAERLWSPEVQAAYYEIYKSPKDESDDAGVTVLQFSNRAALEKVLPHTQAQDNVVYFIYDRYLISTWSDEAHEKSLARLDRLVLYYTRKGAKVYHPEKNPETSMAEEAADSATEAVVLAETSPVSDSTIAVVVPAPPEAPKPRPDKDASQKRLLRQIERDAYEAMEEKRFEAAIAGYEKLIQSEPQNGRAWYNIAWMYATTDRQRKAVEVSQKALTVLPAEEHNQFFRMIGNCLVDLGDYKSGEDYLRRAIEGNPDDENALYNFGYGYFKQHRYDQAIYWLNRALDAGYGNENALNDVYFYIGTSLGEMGRNEEALKYYDKAIAITPYYTYFFNKAQALVRLKRYDEALRVADEGVATAPDSSEVHHKRYQVLRKMDRLTQANESLREAYRRNPNDPDVLLDMGVMYNQNNEVNSALEMYRQGLRYAPDKSVFYSNIAGIYSDNPRTRDSAAYYYVKAIEGNPKKATYYYNFGNHYKNLEQYPKAIGMYEKALALEPDLVQPYTNMALVYLRQDNTAKALEYLERGLALDPNDFELNANRAAIAADEQKREEVIRYATRALENIPKGHSRTNLLNLRANARLMSGQPAEAIYDYLDIVNKMTTEEKKENYSLFSNLGYASIDLHKPKDALRYFEEALSYKEEADPAIGMMLTQYLLGDTRAFEKAKVRAIRLAPALQQGMKGVRKLEEGDYFFSSYQKELLAKILGR